MKELQLKLLISESEKQVAEQKLNDLKRKEKTKSTWQTNDEMKRKQKVEKLLIDLLNLITTNSSLQCMLEMNSLQNYTKSLESGKCYKLLKQILKPFTILIKYLLNTNISAEYMTNLNESKASIPQYPQIKQIDTITSNPSLSLQNHDHKVSKASIPSTVVYKQSSEAATPEKSVKQAPNKQVQQKIDRGKSSNLKTKKTFQRRTITDKFNTCQDY